MYSVVIMSTERTTLLWVLHLPSHICIFKTKNIYILFSYHLLNKGYIMNSIFKELLSNSKQ
jgi:hypothetical protein